MNNLKEEIWILSDGRVGTFSQGIGLAQELKLNYKIIELQYSFFAKLPNFFFSSSKIRLSKKSLSEIKNLQYFPKIIISCGRRAAPIALYLQQQSKEKIKIIQIMNPNLSFEKFDFVILPKHDKVDYKKFPNLITTIGSLNRINQEKIAAEKLNFAKDFEIFKEKKIAVLIGGSSKNSKFDKNSVAKLAKIISKIANNMNAIVFVLNSRRTSEEIDDNFILNLNCKFKFFDCKKITLNPYLAVLGYADFFVVTGDSVSMISECCFTGKTVYIFDEKNISSKKHRKFHQDLFDENYAVKLDENCDILQEKQPKILNETKRVAMLIKNYNN